MIRRLTIMCGLLTLAVAFGLALENHTLFGARAARHQGVQVTTIPDRPASWPPVQPVPPAPPLKGLPPAPQPQPLHQTAPAQHAGRGGATVTTPVQTIVQIANTLFNLPKIIHDRTQDTSR